jgi:NADPH:quinone reductase-like Zn-dependent oxidoreductase
VRAQVLTGFGGPEMLEYRADVPDPVPGPGEVRVSAAAINNTDIWTREGRYGAADDPHSRTGWRREPLRFPRIQGADVVGYIDHLGPGVAEDRIAVGDRVLVPATNVAPVAGPFSDAELATFPIAYGTALRMVHRARLAPGETVLLTGASGGVGSAWCSWPPSAAPGSSRSLAAATSGGARPRRGHGRGP